MERYKAVILIGGPEKGTRFRPLSLDCPKPLFPVAGIPMVQHHIEACVAIKEVTEIILLGFYQEEETKDFINQCKKQFGKTIYYLREYSGLNTGGGLYHFRDRILAGKPKGVFLFNSDVCCNFPLSGMLYFYESKLEKDGSIILSTEVAPSESKAYGCLVENDETHEVTHYVEKPDSIVSPLINCGVYVLSPSIFSLMSESVKQRQEQQYQDGGAYDSSFDVESISLEQDILMPLAGSGKLFVYKTDEMWGQIKSAASALHANKLYLFLYRKYNKSRLAKNVDGQAEIIGDVFIHESASIHSTAVLGPNVTIGKDVEIKEGVRIKNSIVLDESCVKANSCILNSILGWETTVGEWARVEGTAHQPNPNVEFAKIVSDGLFDENGKLVPSVTVLGRKVAVKDEIIVMNSIVLPGKDLKSSTKSQIVL